MSKILKLILLCVIIHFGTDYKSEGKQFDNHWGKLDAVGLGFPQNIPLSELDASFRAVVTNWNRDNLMQAIADATEILKVEPDNSEARFRRGIYYCLYGDLNKSMGDLNDAIRIEPSLGFAYYIRGVLYYEQDLYTNAMIDFTKALRIIPKKLLDRNKIAYAELFNMRAKVYFKIGDLEKATDDLTRAIRINSHNYAFYYSRGIIHGHKGRLGDAIRDFEDSIRYNSTNWMAYQGRGHVYYLQGKQEKAISDYTKAITIEPKSSDTYFSRAIVFCDKGNLDQAISDLNEAIQINLHDAAFYARRGYVYTLKGKYEKSIDDFNEAIRLSPNDATLFYGRGYAFNQQNEWNKARGDYAEAIRLDPESSDAQNELAWLLATCPNASIRDGAEAVVIARKACEITTWKEWSCISTLAAAYAEAGDFKQAVKFQEHTLSMNGLNEQERKEEKRRLNLFQHRTPYIDYRPEVNPIRQP